MEYRYGFIETKFEQKICFGIAAIDANCDAQETATILKSYINLSSNRQSVISFVETCNRLHLSLIHFQDAVHDFIATF